MSALVERVEDRLADFTRDKRVIALSGMALIIGALSAVVADLLVWLIAVITNIAYYRQFSSTLQSPDHHRLGYFAVVIPVIGGAIAGHGFDDLIPGLGDQRLGRQRQQQCSGCPVAGSRPC